MIAQRAYVLFRFRADKLTHYTESCETFLVRAKSNAVKEESQ